MNNPKLLAVKQEAGGLALRRIGAAELTGDAAGAVYAVRAGDPAVFSDGVGGRTFRSAAARFLPVYAVGRPEAPSVSNIIPLTGRTSAVFRRYGENLFFAYGSENSRTLHPDGTVTNDGGPFDAVTGFIPVAGMTSLKFRALCEWNGRANLTFRVVGYDAGRTFVSELYSVTGPQAGETAADIATGGAAYVRAYYGNGAVRGAGLYCGDTAEETEVAFPGAAGTVYGGTIDFAKGTLAIDHEYMSFDGTENWNMFYDGDNRYYSLRIGIAGDVVNDSGVCSHFAPAEVMSTNTAIGQRIWNTTSINAARILIRPGIPDVANVANFKAWLRTQARNGTPVQAAWQVTNPVTVTFDPVPATTRSGVNTVAADCGRMTAEYVRDTAAAIASGDACVSAMLADDAPGGIAGRNFSAGEFLTSNGKLYKALGSIASGEEISDMENAEETTVGEQLAAIWAALNSQS